MNCARQMETAAYAEGRKDEREEWLPVLDLLRLIDRDERIEYTAGGSYIISVDGRDLIAIRAAIAKATG